MATPKILKRRATREERKVAADLGGRRVPLSGAGLEKGDVVIPSNGLYSFRLEVKTTALDSYTLSSNDWSDVVRSALRSGQTPLFHINLAPWSRRVRLVICTKSFFEALFHRANTVDDARFAKSYRITTKRWYEMERASHTIAKDAVPHLSIRLKAPTPTFSDLVILRYETFTKKIEEGQ